MNIISAKILSVLFAIKCCGTFAVITYLRESDQFTADKAEIDCSAASAGAGAACVAAGGGAVSVVFAIDFTCSDFLVINIFFGLAAMGVGLAATTKWKEL